MILAAEDANSELVYDVKKFVFKRKVLAMGSADSLATASQLPFYLKHRWKSFDHRLELFIAYCRCLEFQ